MNRTKNVPIGGAPTKRVATAKDPKYDAASTRLMHQIEHDARSGFRGLTHLASNDADFDRVPGLTRYEPI